LREVIAHRDAEVTLSQPGAAAQKAQQIAEVSKCGGMERSWLDCWHADYCKAADDFCQRPEGVFGNKLTTNINTARPDFDMLGPVERNPLAPIVI
jgi:hypothetical protein